MIDYPICCVCARRNIITPACTWIETRSVKHWYLCEKHAMVVSKSMKGAFIEWHYIKPEDSLTTIQPKEQE